MVMVAKIIMSLLIPIVEAVMVPLLLMFVFTIVMKMAILSSRLLMRASLEKGQTMIPLYTIIGNREFKTVS